MAAIRFPHSLSGVAMCPAISAKLLCIFSLCHFYMSDMRMAALRVMHACGARIMLIWGLAIDLDCGTYRKDYKIMAAKRIIPSRPKLLPVAEAVAPVEAGAQARVPSPAKPCERSKNFARAESACNALYDVGAIHRADYLSGLVFDLICSALNDGAAIDTLLDQIESASYLVPEHKSGQCLIQWRECVALALTTFTEKE